MDLQTFQDQVFAQHAALTKDFETKQAAAEKAWATAEAAATALTAFRGKYTKVMRALKSGGVTVAGAVDAPSVKVEG